MTVSQSVLKNPLTPCQTRLYYYFGDLFDDLNLLEQINVYYYLVYIVRRIIFVSILFFTHKERFELSQIVMLYFVNFFSVIYLLATFPYKLPSQNTLEVANELFVQLSYFGIIVMFTCKYTIAEPLQAIQLYNDVGNVFTGCVVLCLATNLARIIFKIIHEYRLKYTRKLHQLKSRSAKYDREMNFAPGSRRCDCTCYSCSIAAIPKIEKHRIENWGPV